MRDFRSYERAELRLDAGLTVLCGPNGAGKTNCVEALYFGLTGRSCRTANERELVRTGASVARVEVTTAGEDGDHLLEVGFEPGQPKRLRVDGAPVERLPASGPRPPVSVFMPERLDLVKGGPALRRAHLDQFIAALWPSRASTRGAYGRALAQRNALLGRVRAGLSQPEGLEPWDAELAAHGVQLIANREAAAELIAPAFARRAAELGLPAAAELAYRPRSAATDAGVLRAELRTRRESDVARGFTDHGPHRDELVLSHGGVPLRSFGSQGQQRIALLALLFAERDVLLDHCGRPPLMLLDDVMSELDAGRRERLVELVAAGGQTVITTTDAMHVPEADEAPATLVSIAPGSIREVVEPASA